jgi:hypothetical protein
LCGEQPGVTPERSAEQEHPLRPVLFVLAQQLQTVIIESRTPGCASRDAHTVGGSAAWVLSVGP